MPCVLSVLYSRALGIAMNQLQRFCVASEVCLLSLNDVNTVL